MEREDLGSSKYNKYTVCEEVITIVNGKKGWAGSRVLVEKELWFKQKVMIGNATCGQRLRRTEELVICISGERTLQADREPILRAQSVCDVFREERGGLFS